ncbi:MAG TPA: MgtC/SapB family protein [Steroidobacteraceae bacterium]|nr:MgtC/SapB family protein [Steroidobacteraceae bacterium]
MDTTVLSALSLALGLGLLIGLQRERAGSEFGGIRTFPLVALLGTVCGFLTGLWGAFALLAGFLALAAVALLANLTKHHQGEDTTGQTTEVAALITFACGALLTTRYRPAAIVVGGLTAVLLHLKQPMHAFAGRLTERDVQGIMRFAIVSLIVLPLLPDETYGAYDVLNPREIWWMVVLIVGIGLAGYVSYRLFGGRAGIVLAGILGGLVSSTATTVAYARRVKENADAMTLAAVVIVIASTMAAARVIVEVGVVAPRVLPEVGPPLGVLLVWMIVISVVMLRVSHKDGSEMPEQSNPAALRSALIFAAIYALVIFVTAAAKDYFGDRALYAVAFVSGFVDVDAVTLSTSQLAGHGRLTSRTAWQVIVIATLTNLAFKTGIATMLGSTRLLARLAVPVGAALAGGIALLMLWP